MRFLSSLGAVLGVILGSASPTLADATNAAASAALAPSHHPGAYILGPSDRLRVTVFGEPGLSGEFAVSNTGGVAFPLVGEIQAANLSAADLERAIVARLTAGYLRDPRVSVEVISFRPFYILGEVGRPGEYPYAAGLSVANAVATAGGFTARAQRKRVYVRGANEQAERVYPLDGPMAIAPGDTVRVAERLF